MIRFLKRLFERNEPPQEPTPPPPPPPIAMRPTLPPLPEEIRTEFLDWLLAQKKPAVALTPDPSLPIEPKGSRLFGPAFLPEGEEWPSDKKGRTLDFLAQLNLADCAELEGYPVDGFVQFFIGRDDLYGANFDELQKGDFVVRWLPSSSEGSLHDAPHTDEFDQSGIDDFSPSSDFELRRRGIMLKPSLITDQMNLAVVDASKRFFNLDHKRYDTNPLYDELDEIQLASSSGHHTGGYPAFTQSDIREYGEYQEYDHVLLRLTSDNFMMWGDVGECVFMIPSGDLAKGDFSRVIYSWDCS